MPRRELDAYFTPSGAIERLLDRYPAIVKAHRHTRVLEPCSGDGALVTPMTDRGLFVDTNDLVKSRPARTHEDARTKAFYVNRTPAPHWIITNPPFCEAAEMAPLMFDAAITGVALLLRLTFLEPCDDRALWLDAHPPTSLIVLPRISFTDDGNTDSVTCAWMIWDHRDVSRRIQVVPSDGQLADKSRPLFDVLTD